MIIVLWLVRAPAQLFLSSDGVVEIRRGFLFRRRFLLRASSILYYESVATPAGRWLSVNRAKFTIADRGTRDISINAVSFADLDVLRRALSQQEDLGTYRYSRIPDMADDTDEVSTSV